ncbi:hypothetical protein RhiirA5_54271 [Rhizophagus irregularis]|uniref:Uncharacterized protein n=1 Tax=Rhizophagus irregularis TaxID=588596 RepID=A0A2N0Q483_9GLOM|nr:hypothetical protein RhiirA5_54271 [Rhizophagus irregularis]CAB4374083.1 unnamed protein product [Rhizophagus irregularis]CAB4494141.1 unnamed protein product [Rhizophagus irregularis]CAB5213041.1 unnamed protein product [Rhizophagus irregularis]CAB5351203.1 unnamed protein product [Rhizophagus irregularis]
MREVSSPWLFRSWQFIPYSKGFVKLFELRPTRLNESNNQQRSSLEGSFNPSPSLLKIYGRKYIMYLFLVIVMILIR